MYTLPSCSPLLSPRASSISKSSGARSSSTCACAAPLPQPYIERRVILLQLFDFLKQVFYYKYVKAVNIIFYSLHATINMTQN